MTCWAVLGGLNLFLLITHNSKFPVWWKNAFQEKSWKFFVWIITELYEFKNFSGWKWCAGVKGRLHFLLFAWSEVSICAWCGVEGWSFDTWKALTLLKQSQSNRLIDWSDDRIDNRCWSQTSEITGIEENQDLWACGFYSVSMLRVSALTSVTMKTMTVLTGTAFLYSSSQLLGGLAHCEPGLGGPRGPWFRLSSAWDGDTLLMWDFLGFCIKLSWKICEQTEF